MSIYFITLNDLRTWVNDAMGPNVDDDIVNGVCELIQHDKKRPHWGHEDWAEYLEGLDLWHIANGQ